MKKLPYNYILSIQEKTLDNIINTNREIIIELNDNTKLIQIYKKTNELVNRTYIYVRLLVKNEFLNKMLNDDDQYNIYDDYDVVEKKLIAKNKVYGYVQNLIIQHSKIIKVKKDKMEVKKKKYKVVFNWYKQIFEYYTYADSEDRAFRNCIKKLSLTVERSYSYVYNYIKGKNNSYICREIVE